jgi:hypothetical protein
LARYVPNCLKPRFHDCDLQIKTFANLCLYSIVM